MQGPVLKAFSYDEAHPYAAGQHRGVDIGAAAAGETVVAPSAGTVTFAGTVPTSGRSVTIETADGYSVTLTHLGSFLVAKGATVSELDPVGTIGPSGTPELEGPYLHLGIRKTVDPNGYLDPLGLLPPATESAGDEGGSQSGGSQGSGTQGSGTQGSGTQGSGIQGSGTQGSGTQNGSAGAQPGANDAPSTATATEPTASVSASTSVAEARGSSGTRGRAGASVQRHERGQESRSDARPPRASLTPVADAATPRHSSNGPASSSRRPDVETAAPLEPAGLDAGHEPGPSVEIAEPHPTSRRPSSASLALVLNGTAAVVALGAALAAGRRRRCRSATSPVATAQLLRFPGPRAEPATERRRAA